MLLRAANKDTEKYGYPQTMEFNNKNFNGHQIGVAVCLRNNTTNVIEENYLANSLGTDQERENLLNELLNDDKIILLTETATHVVGNDLVPKTMYFMPYFVLEHSRFKPTVMADNISGACNVTYDIEVEVLFVLDEGLSRYLTLPFKTRNIPVMDLVYDFFDYDYSEQDELKNVGIEWKDEDEGEDGEGYYLDFYSPRGERFDVAFRNVEALRRAIASMRLVGIKCHIDGEENNEDESE